MIKLLISFSILLPTSLALAAPSKAWLEPTVGLRSTSAQVRDAPYGSRIASLDGVQLGLRLISAGSHEKGWTLSLNAQHAIFARINSSESGVPGGANTLLGVQASVAVPNFEFLHFYGAYYFADIFQLRFEDQYFHGESFSIGLGTRFDKSLNYLIEYISGNYEEGPGFITTTAHSGVSKLRAQSVSFAIAWPFEFSFDPHHPWINN